MLKVKEESQILSSGFNLFPFTFSLGFAQVLELAAGEKCERGGLEPEAPLEMIEEFRGQCCAV